MTPTSKRGPSADGNPPSLQSSLGERTPRSARACLPRPGGGPCLGRSLARSLPGGGGARLGSAPAAQLSALLLLALKVSKNSPGVLQRTAPADDSWGLNGSGKS
ncbi:unnamed protein product [Natator depressus]